METHSSQEKDEGGTRGRWRGEKIKTSRRRTEGCDTRRLYRWRTT